MNLRSKEQIETVYTKGCQSICEHQCDCKTTKLWDLIKGLCFITKLYTWDYWFNRTRYNRMQFCIMMASKADKTITKK